MQYLPTIIITSLLVFTIALTLVCALWHWRRSKRQIKRKQSTDSYKKTPVRRLTVKGGRVVDAVSALEKGGLDSDHIEDDVPYPVLDAFVDDSEKFPRPPSARPRADGPKIREIRAKIETSAQSPRSPNIPKNARRMSVHEPHDAHSLRVPSIPSTLLSERSGSLTLPRPSLINIERKGSGQRSRRMREKRPRRRDTYPKPGSHEGSIGSSRDIPELPTNLKVPEIAHIDPDGVRTTHRHLSAPAPTAGPTSPGSISSPRLPRPQSISTSLAPPTVTSPGPHVTFAPTRNPINPNRNSFLSLTTSSSSSLHEPTSPHMFAPPPSMVDLLNHRPPPLPTPNELEAEFRSEMAARLNRPPSLDVEIPHASPFSFLSLQHFPEFQQQSPTLRRGHSVQSNRSILTIASSEISSNWTIGDAHAVNIYPSVAPGEGSPSLAPASASDRETPPYAKTLRSKYGRYPRGRRDKALPTVPKSPLRMSFTMDNEVQRNKTEEAS